MENMGEKNIICIGTSTGGPKALQKVLTEFPSNLNAAIMVVQHMPAGFTKSLANRLNQMTDIIVKEAEHNEVVKSGVCYIAPGGYHMEVIKDYKEQLIISLNNEPPIQGHRPSVDKLFKSISKLKKSNKIAVIMTGMGSDGVIGLTELKQQQSYIIAESIETAVIYGMPRAAVLKGIVDQVARLEDIGNLIISKLK